MINSILGRVDQGAPKVRFQRCLQLHRPAQRGAEQIAHLGDLAVEVDLLRLKPLLAREGKELRDETSLPVRQQRGSARQIPDRRDRADCVTTDAR